MPEYKYYCPDHYPSVNKLPQDGLLYAEMWKQQRYFYCINNYVWGYVVYNRPLTEEEIAANDLLAAPEEKTA